MAIMIYIVFGTKSVLVLFGFIDLSMYLNTVFGTKNVFVGLIDFSICF